MASEVFAVPDVRHLSLLSIVLGSSTVVLFMFTLAFTLKFLPQGFEEEVYVMRSSHVLHIIFNRPKVRGKDGWMSVGEVAVEAGN
jgi:hypothetical protein